MKPTIVLLVTLTLAACGGSNPPIDARLDDIQSMDRERYDFCDMVVEDINSGAIQLSPFDTHDYDEWCESMWVTADLYYANSASQQAAICLTFQTNTDADLLREFKNNGMSRDAAIGMLDAFYINCP